MIFSLRMMKYMWISYSSLCFYPPFFCILVVALMEQLNYIVTVYMTSHDNENIFLRHFQWHSYNAIAYLRRRPPSASPSHTISLNNNNKKIYIYTHLYMYIRNSWQCDYDYRHIASVFQMAFAKTLKIMCISFVIWLVVIYK